MPVRLRPFEMQDYPAFAELLRAVRPEHPLSVAELQEDDASVPEGHHFERWLAEEEGVLVGYGAFGHSYDAYHPRKFELRLGVRPRRQGQGIGGQLYDGLARRLAAHHPSAVATKSREDEPVKVRFFERRGFREVMREYESRLDVSSCDLSPYDELEDGLNAQGIRIRTLGALEDDPGFQHELYRLHTALDADVPQPEPYTPPDFRDFARNHFESPRLVKESFFVAVRGRDYIGMSELWPSEAAPYLTTGLTGVLPDFRRRGVALALKVAGVRFAKARGHPEIRTVNAAENRGMLAINERLGFKRQPASLLLRKEMAAPDGARGQ